MKTLPLKSTRLLLPGICFLIANLFVVCSAQAQISDRVFKSDHRIDPEKKVNVITKEERLGFVRLIKNLECTLTGLRDYNEAIITKGGIKIKEVDPGTMESRLVKGLHFAGEVLDLDAVTGGFNLQIAWSTAYAAGTGIESTDE